jgi:hypothetical protein
MSQIFLKNGDVVSISGTQVVTHNVTNIPIHTYLAGAPVNAAVVYPIGGLTGRIKIVAGAGTLPHTLTASIVIDPLFPSWVNRSLSITGPGTYYLPVARNELCRNLRRIVTSADPGGTLTVSLDSWKATLAGDSAAPGTVAGVVYSTTSASGPGDNLLIIQSGVATAVASGAITKGDTVITAAAGKVKTAGMATGVDVVGTALEDALDGAEFVLTVALSSI